MAESDKHLALVDVIIGHVETRYSNLTSLLVLNDKPGTPRAGKPPRLGGFVPDVYAADVPTTTVIVGEAKTARDLENDHTDRQLRAFIEHLKYTAHGSLLLAVPWRALAAARSLVTVARRTAAAHNVYVVLLDDLGTAHFLDPSS